MLRHVEQRIAYGRRIRDRADWLIEAHGAAAAALARDAAEAPGAPDAERLFWVAVARRIDRLNGAPVWRPLFVGADESV